MTLPPSSRPRRAARADWIAYGAIAAYALYSAYLARLFAPSIDPDRFRDFGILMDFARAVAETGRYPANGVYYPPSCMIVFDVLGRLGPEAMFRAHLVAQAAAFGFAIFAWQRILGTARRPERGIAAVIAVLATLFYLRFEFRMHNVNFVSLGLVSAAVLWARRPALAGAALAGNFAIKPYGATLLLPWMAWHRAWRWLAASVAGVVLFYVALPVLWFGVDGTLTLYGDWMRELSALATPERMRDNPRSLQGAVAALRGADIADPAVVATTRALELGWLALLAAYFLMTARARAMPAGERLTAQVGALLIAPLPLGALHQPNRAVVFLVPLLALAGALLDRARPAPARLALAVIVAAVGVLPWLVPEGPPHAALTLALCVLVLGGLAILHATGAPAAPAPPPPA